MSTGIDVKTVEKRLRQAREANQPPPMTDAQRKQMDAVYKAEFQRLIFEDMGRQAAQLDQINKKWRSK